jgi:hypothetical protein
MSLNILKKQVKYCFLSLEDEEFKLLKQKTSREKKIKKINKIDKTEKNIKYFELQEKYKTVSKNVLKYLNFDK